jgi:hypothetical protein
MLEVSRLSGMRRLTSRMADIGASSCLDCLRRPSQPRLEHSGPVYMACQLSSGQIQTTFAGCQCFANDEIERVPALSKLPSTHKPIRIQRVPDDSPRRPSHIVSVSADRNNLVRLTARKGDNRAPMMRIHPDGDSILPGTTSTMIRAGLFHPSLEAASRPHSDYVLHDKQQKRLDAWFSSMQAKRV